MLLIQLFLLEDYTLSMHWLFSGFAALITKFIYFKAIKFGLNMFIIGVYAGVVFALFIGFFITLELLIAGLQILIPEQFLGLVAIFFPSNFQVCFSAIVSIRALKMGLIWALKYRGITAKMILNL